MKKIGLTGNIASGKSETEEIFKSFGFKVVDLDKITNELYKNIDFQKELLDAFNTSDKKEIAKIVFNDKTKLKKLENLIHPKLKTYILNLFKNQKETVVVSGALLFESGFNVLFDKIVFIDAPFDLRLSRLIKRNNLTVEDALKRLNAQNENNKQKADFVVENNSTKENLKQKIEDLIKSDFIL